MPEWMKTCKSHTVTSEQKQGIGTQTHCVMETAGRIIEYDAVVTEYVENKKLAWHCDKPSRTDGIWRLKPVDHGTELGFTMDYDLPYSILGMLMDRFKVRGEMEKDIDKALINLKNILEN
jgi:uncharacterized membrane protein